MRNALNDQFLSPSTRLRNFFIGMVSKATASTLTYPYTLIKVQLQVNGMRKKRKKRDKDVEEKDVEEKEMEENPETKCTMKTVFNDIVSTSGLSGLWNGLSPQLMNAVLKEALLNMVRLEIANVVNRICDNV